MRPFLNGLFTVALTAFLAASGSASPLSSRLLPLVPPGAAVVAGFENHAGPRLYGRLLLTTRNNRLDLEDFQALTGVDSRRVFEDIFEVAAAPPGGVLSEHMLLVAGRFDRALIFRSMELNGARGIDFLGERILLVRPLNRELGDMLDTRWMAILDNRIGIFGTVELVQKALRRYVDHSLPDPVLQERLSMLRRDVTSWNVLVAAENNQTSMNFAKQHSAWARLQQDADVLMVAARFGPKIRIDFSIHADAGRGPEFFARKAGFFTDALLRGQNPEATTPEEARRLLRNFSLEPNRVQGSMELSSRQFEAWCEQLYMVRAGILLSQTSGN